MLKTVLTADRDIARKNRENNIKKSHLVRKMKEDVFYYQNTGKRKKLNESTFKKSYFVTAPLKCFGIFFIYMKMLS